MPDKFEPPLSALMITVRDLRSKSLDFNPKRCRGRRTLSNDSAAQRSLGAWWAQGKRADLRSFDEYLADLAASGSSIGRPAGVKPGIPSRHTGSLQTL